MIKMEITREMLKDNIIISLNTRNREWESLIIRHKKDDVSHIHQIKELV